MKIILNQDVRNLGEEGDVVVVKDGYARNYLLPTGQAVLFTKTTAAIFKAKEAAIEKRKVEKRAESASLKEKLDNVVITLVVPAGESGKLFGSITSTMIQDELAKQDLIVEKKKIEIATHSIKMVGTYPVTIHLYENANSTLKLVIESEAKIKAEKAAAAKAAKEAEVAAAKAAKEAAEAAAKEAEAVEVAEVEATEAVTE